MTIEWNDFSEIHEALNENYIILQDNKKNDAEIDWTDMEAALKEEFPEFWNTKMEKYPNSGTRINLLKKGIEYEEENNNMSVLPKILEDIQKYLKDYKIDISAPVEGEGRGGSLKDEGSVKKALRESPYKQFVLGENARKFGDIIVVGEDGCEYVVNIKTSLGGSDNCFSKAGIVYALTNLSADNIPRSMNYNKMKQLIEENKTDIPPWKDYYFLCIDKDNASNVMIRGAKQIANWKTNPSNVLQINWKKEKISEPVNRTWEEAYDVLINGAKKSLLDFFVALPEEWKKDICSACEETQ